MNKWAKEKISVTDLILKVISAAYQDVPEANCIWNDEEMVYFGDVSVALAVATDNGLITPVIRNVNTQKIDELHLNTKILVDKARSGSLKQNEIEGGVISLTNLGMYGVESFTAIINPPQSMILAIGAAIKTPIVIDDKIVSTDIIKVTISVDHRAVDGALAAQWLQAFKERFENPYWLVLGN